MAARPGGESAERGSLIPAKGGPAITRILLGARLRRLRESRKISRADAAAAIRASGSKITRLELGRVGAKRRDVEDLLSLYGATDADGRQECLALADRATRPNWWQGYADVLPTWFEAYIALEEAASLIRSYEVQFVPGLLQTGEYVRAVARLGHPGEPAERIDRYVELRTRRQRLLEGPNPPRLSAVVDEAVLRRPLGGLEVMRRQLGHLIEMSRLPHVTLQVIPFHHGGHAAAGGSFSILRFTEPDLPDVVYLEQLTSALYLDKPENVGRYQSVMDALLTESDSPATTTATLEAVVGAL